MKLAFKAMLVNRFGKNIVHDNLDFDVMPREIIGVVGGNGTGVAGVCWSVKLMNAKFLGNRGGTTAIGRRTSPRTGSAARCAARR